MHFDFATAGRILFGPGSLRQAGTIAREFGRHALVVTGRDETRAERLLDLLAAEEIRITTRSIAGEPTTNLVAMAATQARAAGCEVVIGFGGGSVLDAAKAIAALLTNPGDLFDYLEVVGRGQPLSRPAAPCIAIPTTAGTGSEVTRNAVLTAPAQQVKASLRSASMLPRVALVDPELTLDLPPGLTAATGLDALTQLIEPYVSFRANPFTDALCLEGIRRAARSLPRAFRDGRDLGAREDMALASLLGGMALANAGLGAAHGFAAPIGGMFPAPHGAVCAALLPHVMAANIAAARDRQPVGETLRRYETIARLVTGRSDASGDDGVIWIRQLVADLRIPGLRTYGITPGQFPVLVEKAARASSMKANPLPLTAPELTGILAAAL